jgi:acetyl-CoA carboxylase biotin carboxyl carrier protein
VPLSDEDVREILRLIDESDVEELRLQTPSFSIHVLHGRVLPGEEDVEHEAALRETGAPEADGGAETISSPMLGTFYRAEAPGAAPYVDVGAHVEPDTVVCLIEVMKMMNPIPAGVRGTIVDICAENAEPVEYGAPLFRVRTEE